MADELFTRSFLHFPWQKQKGPCGLLFLIYYLGTYYTADNLFLFACSLHKSFNFLRFFWLQEAWFTYQCLYIPRSRLKYNLDGLYYVKTIVYTSTEQVKSNTASIKSHTDPGSLNGPHPLSFSLPYPIDSTLYPPLSPPCILYLY